VSTLLFDLDGTLLDVRARHYAVYATLVKELRAEPHTESIFWRRRRAGASAAQLLPELPPGASEQFTRRWLEEIESPRNLRLDVPYGGAIRALRRLAERHRLVLITLRRDPEALDRQLEETGLGAFFQSVVSSGAGRLMRKAELWPRDRASGATVVVGDSEADVELATDLGAAGIFVTFGMRSPGFLKNRGATCLSNSLAGVVNALDGP